MTHLSLDGIPSLELEDNVLGRFEERDTGEPLLLGRKLVLSEELIYNECRGCRDLFGSQRVQGMRVRVHRLAAHFLRFFLLAVVKRGRQTKGQPGCCSVVERQLTETKQSGKRTE
jgi:hypothetical protein